MTEEGKRLFKFAGMGLGGLIGLMLIIRLISSFTGGSASSQKEEGPRVDPFASLAQSSGKDTNDAEEEVHASAKRSLVTLLHSYAFNHYRSGRLKDAIRLWEIAGYLEPDDAMVQLRLAQAKDDLNRLIDENTAIANQDFMALRYERAVEFYQRAANYAADFDGERYRDLQNQITRAEKKMAR